MRQSSFRIPIVTDVIRNIDGLEMVRCSYFSFQSDTPLPDWSLTLSRSTYPILLLNIEAILIGPIRDGDRFRNLEDIESMYDYADENEGLFVDINDIWVPLTWFRRSKIEQGMVYRIPQDRFIHCWQLRNDNISIEEFISINENIVEFDTRFSEEETLVFKDWVEKQISRSKEIYRENRESYLKKIKQ